MHSVIRNTDASVVAFRSSTATVTVQLGFREILPHLRRLSLLRYATGNYSLIVYYK